MDIGYSTTCLPIVR